MKRLKRPSPSMVVALLALFVAMSGTAVAAKVMITSSKQIKDGAVHRADIAKAAIDSTKVANGSLSLTDLDSASKGSIQNAGAQALEAFRKDGPNNVAAGKQEKVATLSNIPAGAYAIFAKTVLTAPSQDGGVLNPGGSVGGHCVLDAGGDTDESRILLGTPGANSPAFVSTQITHSYASPGEASLTCDTSNSTFSASNTSIIAVRANISPRQAVNAR